MARLLYEITLRNYLGCTGPSSTFSDLFSSRELMNRNFRNKFLSLGRWRLREVIQMITGHGMLRRHRFISNKTDSPLCEKCSMGAEEYPDHFVGTCPAFQQLRQEIFGKATTTLKAIIAAENIKLLSQYIHRTERLKEPFN